MCVYIYIFFFSSFSCESEGRVKLIEKAWFSDQVLEAFSPGELHQESLFPKRNKKQISDCWSALPQAPWAVLQILVVPSMVWCSVPQLLPAHKCQNKKLGAQPVRKPRGYPDSTWGKLMTTNAHHPLWQGISSDRADSSAREVTTLGKRERLGWEDRESWQKFLSWNPWKQ